MVTSLYGTGISLQFWERWVSVTVWYGSEFPDPYHVSPDTHIYNKDPELDPDPDSAEKWIREAQKHENPADPVADPQN
jgi:hypothetical protein